MTVSCPVRSVSLRKCLLPVGHHSTGRPRIASYATYRSRTALNTLTAAKHVPEHNKPLHAALQTLSESPFLDQSRLSLALKSLESASPVLRVGILAVDDVAEHSARLLARTILSDALSASSAWEEAITASSRPLILKYGSEATPDPRAAEFSVPSRFLQQKGVEILLMRTSGEVLSPALETGVTAGHSAQLRYPLHRAVVVGKGIDGAVKVGQTALTENRDLIRGVVDIDASVVESNAGADTAEGVGNGSGRVLTPVHISRAHKALETFRLDPATGPAFNTAWQTSGIPAAIAFLAPDDTRLAIKAYVSQLLRDALVAIEFEHDNAARDLGAREIPDVKRAKFQEAISAWAAAAHADLQTNIQCSENVASWRSTSWFRLPWAVDDVGHAGDFALQRWLTRAEIELAFLTGATRGAGFESCDDDVVGARHDSKEAEPMGTDELPESFMTVREGALVETPWRPPPWSQSIHLMRQSLSENLVPRMQSKAQTLLLQTLTTISATSALGFCWHLSFGGGIYEAGAVAALGLVLALRRLQKCWNRERKSFLAALMSSGRGVLVDVERALRDDVRKCGKGELDPEDLKRWEAARTCIQQCRSELDKM